MILRGEGGRSDFAADYVSARALLDRTDPYPVLGPAFENVGLDWQITTRSTHPPTVGLLALPVARLSWPMAAAVWGWAMLLAIVVAAWAVGFRVAWACAIGVLLVLIWPPAAWSIGQVTALWLLGAALAWRWRERPFLAGLAIAIASMTKLLPALLLVPFLLRRRWGAALGFAVAWAVALLALLALDPQSISSFVRVEVNQGAEERARGDNGALLEGARNHGGVLVALAALLLVIVVAAVAFRQTKPDVPLSAAAYAKWVWLSVAVLPVAWIYSLLPLALVLLVALWAGRVIAVLAAGAAIVLSMIQMPFSADSSPLLIWAIALCGVALIPAARARTGDSTRSAMTTTDIGHPS